MSYQPVDHYAVLVNHLSVDPLLPYLRHQNWLTSQECDMLNTVPNTHYKQKMELIVQFLRQKNGKIVCDDTFVKSIIWSGQLELAKLLGYNEHFIQQVLHCQPFPAGGNAYPMDSSPIPGPYPPPPGAYNVPPVMKWSAGEIGSAVEARRMRMPSSEVLHPTCIVYSKYDDPNNYVCDLSDFLNHCGVDCDIDQYHAGDTILDWGGWVEMMIKNRAARNGYMLLVCSPTLHCKLSNTVAGSKIDMKAAHISNLTLNTLIKDENITNHVIPIFLEQYRKECVPSCLAGRSCYSVCFTKLLQLSSHGAGIDAVLNVPELESLRALVYRLRGEQEVIKPVIPSPVSPRNVNASPAISPPVFVPPELSPQHNQQQQLGRSLNSPTISQRAQSPKKASRVEGEVMDEFLQKVADNIGRDWSRLGVRLGIEFRTLEQIRHSVPYDIRQQAYLMLVQWKESHKTVATMVELQDKLDELKLGRIGTISRT